MKELKQKLKILSSIILCFIIALLFNVKFIVHDADQKIVIGTKNFTEQYLLGEIVAQLIETHSDIKVKRRFNLGGTNICFNALKTGNIDLYFEYTGTAILNILKKPILKEDLYEYVKESFDRKYQLIWLDRLGFSNKYGLVVLADQKMQKISDLENRHDLKYGFSNPFLARLEFEFLKKDYPKLNQIKMKQMNEALLYYTLLKNGVDVISGSSTDGRLYSDQFTMLIDDKKSLPAYEVAPLIRKDLLIRFPKLQPILALLKGAINEQEMRHMNHLVEFENEDPSLVAKNFLRQKHLLFE